MGNRETIIIPAELPEKKTSDELSAMSKVALADRVRNLAKLLSIRYSEDWGEIEMILRQVWFRGHLSMEGVAQLSDRDVPIYRMLLDVFKGETNEDMWDRIVTGGVGFFAFLEAVEAPFVAPKTESK